MSTDERRVRLIDVIASQLDRPNVFMGGPSPGAKIRAEYIYDAIRASDEAVEHGKRAATLIGEAIAESKIDLAAMMGGYNALGAAVMARLEAAGMVLVPREAIDRMIIAGANAQYPMGPEEVWRAMLAAATESDNG